MRGESPGKVLLILTLGHVMLLGHPPSAASSPPTPKPPAAAPKPVQGGQGAHRNHTRS